MPTISANAKSLSVAPPKKSSAATGSSVMNVVASERRIVSHSETFAIVANDARRISGMFSLIAVEDDDRVVDRVAEHGEDRGDRRGRHLASRQRVDADSDQDVVQHREDHRHRELQLEADRDVERRSGRARRRSRGSRLARSGGRSSTRRSSRRSLSLSSLFSSVVCSCACSAAVSVLCRIWKLLYCRRRSSLPRPWTTASAVTDLLRSASRTSSIGDRLRRRERDLRAALEVDAEVQAPRRERDRC